MSVVNDIIEVTQKKGSPMAQYYVKTLVTFTGTIEADSQAEAEELGYYYDNLEYDGVYEVEVEEIDDEEEDEDDE
jgi:peptidoglycan hydrolase-like protein with peptidoglycan-binding domain